MFNSDCYKLQKIGIIRWKLKYPITLKNMSNNNNIGIIIPKYVRLLIITENFISLNVPLICDVLNALCLYPDQTLRLSKRQTEFLPKNFYCNSWQIGLKEKIQFLDGNHLFSPDLNDLMINISSKRELWKQILSFKKSIRACSLK